VKKAYWLSFASYSFGPACSSALCTARVTGCVCNKIAQRPLKNRPKCSPTHPCKIQYIIFLAKKYPKSKIHSPKMTKIRQIRSPCVKPEQWG
jgi:hypothetical protein